MDVVWVICEVLIVLVCLFVVVDVSLVVWIMMRVLIGLFDV